ncbi:TPA: negative regulator GrlR [Salmonella enterica]|uniref:Negative regulator GrlR n=1 Tax=Salmonella enterica TaxID=28901 RepID=A0A754EDX4_SALER|nr:GrlR family regulatory protein [Salmonella enterica]ECU9162063.1 negative regulator GrlR [Salmonella enterica subsp. enterica serovar Newport str. CFSAN000599]EDU1194306.1 negative regulator GrlR [Salmonella enterica subsp. enterica serovar Heidelberg str. CFSAN000576]HAF8579451.1 negative regulator GrlR [Salmonella enterica]
MKDGIYYVTFRSNMSDFGNGIAVVKNKAVNGGDFTCVYHGILKGDSVQLDVEVHDKSRTSVFGNTEPFTLHLNAVEAAGGYMLSGYVSSQPQMKIDVDAKYIGDLVE